MPHLGRAYPFFELYWQVETAFWPNYMPRKFVVSCTNGSAGDSWELLQGGVVTDEMIPNYLATGDCIYNYTDPAGGFTLYLYFKKLNVSPKRYSIILRMEVPGPHAQILSQETGPVTPSWRITGPWLVATNDPPWFLPGPHDGVAIRPALWSEV